MNKSEAGGLVRLRKFFNSMKLGLFLLGIIAFTASLGTIIPQETQDPAKAGAVPRMLQVMGFTHLYATIWFRALLGLLCLNLLACSVQRYRGIYKRTFHPQPPKSITDIPAKVRREQKWKGAGIQKAVESVFLGRGYHVLSQSNEKDWAFIATKHRAGNWGAFISHMAFVVLIIGALAGNLFGFKGYVMAGSGTVLPLQDIQISHGRVTQPFKIKINSAEDRFLPNGERDNWYTDLSIISDGKEAARQTLSVNHPFTYQGITFYQADYKDGARFKLAISGQEIQVDLQNRGGNVYQIPGTDLYILLADIQQSPHQATAFYQIYQGNETVPAESGKMAPGETVNVLDRYKFTFVKTIGFTGLQIKEDPGIGIIWLGSLLLLCGLLLSFYWKPSQFSGIFRKQHDEQGKLIFGAADKLTVGMRKELDQIVQELEHHMSLREEKIS